MPPKRPAAARGPGVTSEEPVDPVTLVTLVTRHPECPPTGALDEILDEIDELIARFVAMPSDAARHAVAVWAVHTWLMDQPVFDTTPRLAILSPEKRSGKTRLLEVLEQVVARPQRLVALTPAALYRLASNPRPPTFLVDELDTLFTNKQSDTAQNVQGVLNAGWRRGTSVVRADKPGFEVSSYDTWAAVALAGIGDPHETILDRSVVVRMRRRRTTDQVAEFLWRDVESETEPIRERLDAWALAHVDDVARAPRGRVAGVTDRAADSWEPLLRLGHLAGPEWAQRIDQAAINLCAIEPVELPTLGIQLLDACREAFHDDLQLPTDELLDRLMLLDESPWANLAGRPIDARFLARKLKPYGVRPGVHRYDEHQRRGYLRSEFVDAWDRYLPPGGTP